MDSKERLRYMKGENNNLPQAFLLGEGYLKNYGVLALLYDCLKVN